jgi:CDP-diacylglycerol--serine O-phosphatidyltransferase
MAWHFKVVGFPSLNPAIMTSQSPSTKKKETKADALQQYQNSDGHFSLVRYVLIHVHVPSCDNAHSLLGSNFRLADLVTIMNGFCGSFSIFSSARYLVSNDKDHLWAALTYPLAGLMFDFFDGKVARWRKSASLLGQELDSLADLVSSLYFISINAHAGHRSPLELHRLFLLLMLG